MKNVKHITESNATMAVDFSIANGIVELNILRFCVCLKFTHWFHWPPEHCGEVVRDLIGESYWVLVFRAKTIFCFNDIFWQFFDSLPILFCDQFKRTSIHCVYVCVYGERILRARTTITNFASSTASEVKISWQRQPIGYQFNEKQVDDK